MAETDKEKNIMLKFVDADTYKGIKDELLASAVTDAPRSRRGSNGSIAWTGSARSGDLMGVVDGHTYLATLDKMHDMYVVSCDLVPLRVSQDVPILSGQSRSSRQRGLVNRTLSCIERTPAGVALLWSEMQCVMLAEQHHKSRVTDK
jgi:hypothetical protein